MAKRTSSRKRPTARRASGGKGRKTYTKRSGSARRSSGSSARSGQTIKLIIEQPTAMPDLNALRELGYPTSSSTSRRSRF